MTKKPSPDIRCVTTENIPFELHKLLKFENMVNSGGEAKTAVAQGLVLVNGAVETRKRKKLFPGDVVEFNGQRIQLKRAP